MDTHRECDKKKLNKALWISNGLSGHYCCPDLQKNNKRTEVVQHLILGLGKFCCC